VNRSMHGPGPAKEEWFRDIRDECSYCNVPFFLKQMVVDGKLVKEPHLDGNKHLEFPERL